MHKQAAAHFGTDDIVINKYQLNSVHTIALETKENQELDFYLDTKYDIYLLHLRNNSKKCISVFTATGNVNMIYIVAELPYTAHLIPDAIQSVCIALRSSVENKSSI